MTGAELRKALDAAGYADATVSNGAIHLRIKNDAMTYGEHRRKLQAAGIPLTFGGIDIPGWYFFSVKLTEGT